jgi:hypothetical protein
MARSRKEEGGAAAVGPMRLSDQDDPPAETFMFRNRYPIHRDPFRQIVSLSLTKRTIRRLKLAALQQDMYISDYAEQAICQVLDHFRVPDPLEMEGSES